MGIDPTAKAGHQMGRMVSSLLADTVVKANAATSIANGEMRKRAIETIMEDWETRLSATLGEIIGDFPEGEDEPGIIKLMRKVADKPQNQTDLIVQILLFIPMAMSSIGQMGQIVWQDYFNSLYSHFPDVPLSPAELANSVVRGQLDQAAAANLAAESGINAENFARQVAIAGDGLGIEQINALYRQGFIDYDRWASALAYSRLNPSQNDIALQTAWSKMTAGDAISAYVKGVLSHDDAQLAAQQAGLWSGDFDTVAESAGDALGTEQALNLWNHGLISEDDAKAVIAYSRINPKFQDMALLLRFKFLSPYQIVTAVKSGDATAEEATSWLLAQGYDPDQVKAVVSGAATPAATTAKNATESLILDTYEAGLITNAQAVEQLGKVGYSAAAAGVILESYDARKMLSMTQSAVGQIKKVYLANLIDDTTARTDLQNLGVDMTVVESYLNSWRIEKSAEIKTMTVAQIGTLAKDGAITYDYARQRWAEMGYVQPDLNLLSLYYDDPSIPTPYTP